MKQKHEYMKKQIVLPFTLLIALLVISAATGGNGVAMNGYPSPIAGGSATQSRLSGFVEGTIAPDRAETTAQGIRACVPRPFDEPPPSVREYLPAASGQGPCPEGFVPQPVERWARKGRPLGEATSAQRSTGSGAAPPSPAAGAGYYYSGAYQWAVSPGTSAVLTQHLPWLMPTDYHSLAEIAVESTDLRQIVETGWTVDRFSFGDEYPHLFVYHWVDGNETCYNGCGWVQVSPTRFPGMKLAYDGTASQYMIEYRQGNWWIGYEGEWIGYFPGSLWNASFTSSGIIQWFGELCTGSQGATFPFSSIGNYYQGESGVSDAAQMSQITLFDDSGGLRGPATPSFYDTDSSLYSTCAGSESNAFWYGGHGSAP